MERLEALRRNEGMGNGSRPGGVVASAEEGRAKMERRGLDDNAVELFKEGLGRPLGESEKERTRKKFSQRES